MSTLKDDLRSFRRSWIHHTGMQLATLTVLGATFSVVAFVLSLSLNLSRVLSSWGEGMRLSIYLEEDLGEKRIAALRKEIEGLTEVASVEYLPREAATASFKEQLASHAPDLLADSEFANPFPASFRVQLKQGVQSEHDVMRLESLARVLDQKEGVEDVSYGQSWVHNYSSFVTTIHAGGGTMIAILLIGGIFVIGNSIRISISARREEIEILELVGATASMIRRPYVSEGAIMGALASACAIVMNFGLYAWQKSALSSSSALARVTPLFTFFDFMTLLLFLVIGTFLGAFGAWMTVRQINDGWSASSKNQEA